MGFYLVVVEGMEVAKECECRESMIQANRIRFANIPTAFKDMSLSNFNIEVYSPGVNKEIIGTACKSIKVYKDNFEEMQKEGMGLYIYSKAKGSGKTRMAASIANHLLEKHQVKFAVSADILKEIKNTYNKDSKYTESQLIDALNSTEILVIDDFGVEKITDWVNEQFYSIINNRYINKKVTIITSNDSLDDSAYDERIIDRIRERTFQIKFPEESIREKISKKNNMKMINDIKG